MVAAPDQHHQLRFRKHVTGEVIPERADVRDVLVALLRHRRPAHSCADGNSRVFSLTSCVRFELEFISVEHVGVHRGVRRSPGANPVAGHLEHCLTAFVVQVGRAERTDDLGGLRY